MGPFSRVLLQVPKNQRGSDVCVCSLQRSIASLISGHRSPNTSPSARRSGQCAFGGCSPKNSAVARLKPLLKNGPLYSQPRGARSAAAETAIGITSVLLVIREESRDVWQRL